MKVFAILLAAFAVSATPIANPEADPEADPELHQLEARLVAVRATGKVNCRTGPSTSAGIARTYSGGSSLGKGVACKVQGTVIDGTNVWLKVDPGPGLGWCYATAAYTNYFSSSVPTVAWCTASGGSPAPGGGGGAIPW